MSIPTISPEVEAKQVELFNGGEHLAEYRFRKKDGSFCWVSDEQHLIRDKRPARRGGRLLERHRRPQGRRAGVSGGAERAREGDCGGA